VDGQPALLIDEQMCPMLVRALKGGWRYKLDKHEEVQGASSGEERLLAPGRRLRLPVQILPSTGVAE
jgi:hypothetical protein